ncbi:MAG: hypothetical protein N3A38_15040 [Planctomycetota bacterium]|nr:hypothetical protein [Planctomycetota bacterium]
MRPDGADRIEWREPEADSAEAVARYLELTDGEGPAGAIPPALPPGDEAAIGEAREIEGLLREAFLRARPSDSFVAGVMATLPRRGAACPASGDPASGDPAAGPRTAATVSLRVFASDAGGRRRTVLALVSAAALAMLAVIAWLAAAPLRHDGGSSATCGTRPLPVVGRGLLLSEGGAPVERVEAGKRYRVPPFSDAVLRLRREDTESLVKVAKGSEFDVPEPVARPALNLRCGTLYAYEPGSSPLVLKSETMEAEIKGLTMMFREASGPGLPADEGWGQGLIVVLKGSALVRDAGMGGEFFLDEGRLYVTGFPVEAWTEFVGRAEERAHAMEKEAAARGAESRRSDRDLYARTVENYRRDLAAFDAAMAAAAGSDERSGIEERKRRVKRLLEAHERRLAALSSDGTGEPPAVRAKRLRRAATTVREGCRGEIDPRSWM